MKIFSRKGFTLVEIMSGIAIVGLCSALTVPNIVRMRMDVNETGVETSLRAIYCAMESYRTINGSYPDTFLQLTDKTAGLPYIDSSVTGSKWGYTMELSSNKYTYLVKANPQESGVTGSHIFTMDESGNIQKQAISTSTAEPSNVTPSRE